jgi:hypothetical protein
MALDVTVYVTATSSPNPIAISSWIRHRWAVVETVVYTIIYDNLHSVSRVSFLFHFTTVARTA